MPSHPRAADRPALLATLCALLPAINELPPPVSLGDDKAEAEAEKPPAPASTPAAPPSAPARCAGEAVAAALACHAVVPRWARNSALYPWPDLRIRSAGRRRSDNLW